jgi:hypothetical protein
MENTDFPNHPKMHIMLSIRGSEGAKRRRNWQWPVLKESLEESFILPVDYSLYGFELWGHYKI